MVFQTLLTFSYFASPFQVYIPINLSKRTLRLQGLYEKPIFPHETGISKCIFEGYTWILRMVDNENENQMFLCGHCVFVSLA